MDAATRRIAARPAARHAGLLRDDPAGRHDPRPLGADARRRAPGLTAGEDFHLVFRPERVLTGRVFADLRRYPKLVGGVDEAAGAARRSSSTRRSWTSTSAPTWPGPTACGTWVRAEAAELAKLAETTYRDVNIGLANQFALLRRRRPASTSTRSSRRRNSQPYSHIHRPGIAVGGHCIPVYPRLYLWNDPDATVVRAAREANAAMPERTRSTCWTPRSAT